MVRRRPDPQSELLALIDLAYQAATAPDGWPAFLERFTRATSSRGATFMVHDLGSGEPERLLFHGFDPGLIVEYRSWAPKNVYFLEGASHLKTGVVVRGEECVDDRHVMRTEFFNEYLRRVDTLHHTAACVFQERSLIALLIAQRAIKQPSHTDGEKRLIEALVPHVQRAVAIQQQLASADLERASAAAALDQLSVGVCILDGRGRAIAVNRAAREVFDQRDGLSLGALGISADAPRCRPRLAAAIAAACRATAAEDAPDGGWLLIPRPSHRRSFVVLTAPLRLRAFDLGSRAPAAILLVSDPERKHEGVEDVLARLYELSPAEARVARMLLDGESVEDVSERLAVTRDTVRTHLKRIFSKTETRGQSDLIRLVLGWAAQIALPRGERG